MPPNTERLVVAGPAGPLECAVDAPGPHASSAARGLVVLCHPHPLHGGTMDNKVVMTLARTFVQLGWRCVRFNFRGVGGSGGAWDEGRGEVDDALAVIAAQRAPGQALVLGGFSFGGYVATQAAARLAAAGDATRATRLVLVAPAAGNFALAPVPADTLVVHGEADDVVPLAAVLDWARPQALPITLVPGTGHFFHGQLTLLKQIVGAAFA
ncbi:MAG: alpha/beta fold hydrolase [Burkholderiales bacterium]|nr:alpha/beta fold hydrolase [Burkholderiales bacterium]